VRGGEGGVFVFILVVVCVGVGRGGTFVFRGIPGVLGRIGRVALGGRRLGRFRRLGGARLVGLLALVVAFDFTLGAIYRLSSARVVYVRDG
jgi:hypothetical protein